MTAPKFKPEQVVRYGSRTYKVRGYDTFNDHYTLVPTQETIDACKDGWADVQRCIKAECMTPVEPEFQVGDKVRTLVGEILSTDNSGYHEVKFPTVEGHFFPNRRMIHPLSLELVERPKPKKKPGSIWSKEGIELIFLDHQGHTELYWYGDQGRTVTHSREYASTFTEVTE